MALQYFGAMGESESNHSGLKRKLASTRQHNISVVPCSDRAASRCWVRLARGPREHPMPPGVPCPVAQKSAPPRRACPSTDGPRQTPVPCPRRRVALLSSGSGTKTRARRPAAASQGHSAQLPAPGAWSHRHTSPDSPWGRDHRWGGSSSPGATGLTPRGRRCTQSPAKPEFPVDL